MRECVWVGVGGHVCRCTKTCMSACMCAYVCVYVCVGGGGG